jgi:hypothetical protein
MRFRPSSIGWGVLAFIIGALPAFWLGGPALFADGPLGERLIALAAYAAAMIVLAIGGGTFAPSHRLAVGVGMALPILGVLLLVEWSQPWAVGLGAAFVAVAAVTTWAGTFVGARLAAAALARKASRER